MSEVVRLTLLSHGLTEAMSARRFPTDEPLSDVGLRQVDAIGDLVVDRVLVGPELRTRQTAERLGCQVRTDECLADLDCGRWKGRTLSSVDPGELSQWMTDPTSAPHGGQSITDLIERTSTWLHAISDQPGRTVAVTHPAVIRAAILTALHAPPEAFWRIDILPASRTTLHYRSRSWTLRVR